MQPENCFVTYFFLLLINLLLLCLFSSSSSSAMHMDMPQSSSTIVETLPGYDGPLPFKLQTGYIGVGETEEVQLFYYFVESESDPVNDPLILWLLGGPGCSGLFALVYEIGPLLFDVEGYDGGFPSLLLNPYSWTKVANIIFIDSPVGAGFSYSNTLKGYHSSDTKAVQDLYIFLQKWLLNHPKFLKNDLYISGDSYSGKWIPMLSWIISQGNEAGIEPHMSLQGYTMGNPFTDKYIDENAQLPFAHRLALLSDKYYQMAKTECKGNYVKPDTSNELCALALKHYNECIQNIYAYHILEPKCQNISESQMNRRRDDLEDKSLKMLLTLNPGKQQQYQCRRRTYALGRVWANDPSVQEALRVRKGTIKEWIKCNHSVSYDINIESVIHYHHLLSMKRYKALVYSGDHDFVIPYIGTLEWIYKLNLTLNDDWREWTVDNQVAGYTQRFKQDQSEYNLTFATVKGAGHTAPEFKPKESLAMIKRFFSTYPL